MTRIAIIGSGNVGRTLARGLRASGHTVQIGSRTPHNVNEAGVNTVEAVLNDAELIINATPGGAAPTVFTEHAGAVSGRTIIDVSNTHGLRGDGIASVAEELQHATPDAHVVKALNTMAAPVMIAPNSLPHPPTTFIAGHDADAKTEAKKLLESLGWDSRQILDVGDLGAARALEAMFQIVPHIFRTTGPTPLALSALAPNLP